MHEVQWDRARRAMAESARLVAESDGLRKDVARTVVQTSKLLAGLIQAAPIAGAGRRRSAGRNLGSRA